MKYIASCSFGKDSLAAIISRMEHGEPVDGAVYCRVMFDSTTSAEFPDHEYFIHNTAIPLLKSRYGIETTIVQGDITYCQQFYTKYTRGQKIGLCYGFPMLKGAWCNDRLKIRPIRAWKKKMGEYIDIVGIAADETKRINRKAVLGTCLPLVEHGVTEAQAFDLCKRHGLLSPAYNGGRTRLGCWFCHNQRIRELRRLRHDFPALWRRLMDMDADSFRTFKPGNKTIHDFDIRFENEDTQLTFEEAIVWEMKNASAS